MQASGDKVVPSGKADVNASLISHTLDQILASGPFHGSKRCRDFLSYAVEKALDGDVEALKERTIAIEVFGRKANADLDHDSIVRVGAREVRKRLAEYYTTEGAAETLRIELTSGSYVPTFHSQTHPHNGEAEPAQKAPMPRRRRLWVIALAAAGVLAALVFAKWIWLPSRGPAEFEAFWSPVLQQRNPVLIVLAHPIVYLPSLRATLLNDKKNPASARAGERAIDLPPKSLDGSDYVPVYDHYVGLGDSLAAVELARLFERRGRVSRVRLASKLQFDDLREAPAVLIGAFTNRWTVEFMQSVPYRFSLSGGFPSLEDSQTGKQWALKEKSANDRSREDYIMICRLPQAKSGNLLIVGAGLTQYGTEEAGRILADPAALSPILRKLPATWKGQNMALVLRSQVVDDAPAPSELIAYKVW